MKSKGLSSLVALVAALVLFFAANIVAARIMPGVRLDLTEGKLYTLSQGSKNIAKGMKEPITLTLYLTEKAASEVPPVRPYALRVKEVLREFAGSSEGKIKLRIVDPEPFSEAEDKAVAAGIGGVPTGRGEERLYFGLVGENSTTGTEVIPFFDPSKEEFLEFDVAKLINSLSDTERKPLGLISWLPIEGQENNPLMRGRSVPPWQISRRLKEQFTVKPLGTDVAEIPADIKVLVLVHPKGMSEKTQYAIDQFVLRGGRALVFIDPHCEADVPPGVDQMQAMQMPKASSLPKLLGAWGVEMDGTKIAADLSSALQINVGREGRPEVAPYVAWLELTKEKKTLSLADPVTGQLERMFMASAGILTKKEGTTLDVQPVIMTSDKGSTIEQSSISFVPDPKKLLAGFKAGSSAKWTAVRITGKAKSAFPDGAPKEAPPADPASPTPPPAPAGNHIAESAEPIGVIVVADCDMLGDQFWIRESRLGNLLLGYNEISDNGAFAVAAAANLSGSTDLMSLRARGKSSRPFTKIQDLEKEAQQRYQAKEQELQGKLRETEQKINSLSKKGPDGQPGRISLTAEQQKEIDNFRMQMVQTRKELRAVKFDLDKDTRNLKMRLMAINVGLVPALIAVFAVGLAAYRSSRRAADRQAASKD